MSKKPPLWLRRPRRYWRYTPIIRWLSDHLTKERCTICGRTEKCDIDSGWCGLDR